MDRTQKEKEVASLHEIFLNAQNAVLVEFKGITVAESEQLRRKIGEGKSHFRVFKNTLALRATDETPLEVLKEHFIGSTAIAWNEEDPMVLAKSIVEFSKNVDKLKLKAAILEGKPAKADEVRAFASLPSRDQIIFQLYYVIQSPLRRFVTALSWHKGRLVNVLNAIKEMREKEN